MKQSNQSRPSDDSKKKLVKRKDSLAVKKEKQDHKSTPGNWFYMIVFLVFAFVLYGNTVKNKYALDDEYVTNNPVTARGLKAIPEIFSTHYITSTGNVGSIVSEYRPMTKATFALEYQLWGDKPGRSHIINVLIYGCIAMLIFFTLRRFLKNFHVLLPFLITLLFMAHPVHTEVVASLKNREELLAFLCGMSGLWFLLNYIEKGKILSLFFMFMVFIIGYLSKPSILPFLALYFLVLYFFTDTPAKKYVWVLAGIVVVGLLAQYGPKLFLPPVQRVKFFIENPLFFDQPIGVRLGTSLLSLLFYLKMLVLPYPLLYYYGYNMIPLTNLADFKVILSLIIHLGLLFFALYKFREKHFLSFAILWYLIGIFLYSNLPGPVVGIVGERFLFLASLGFCSALAYLAFLVFRVDPRNGPIKMNKRFMIIGLVVFLLLPGTALTINRNRDWRNLFMLYHTDIKHLSNSAKANIDYAGLLMKNIYQDENFLRYGLANEFQTQTIISHFRQSIRIYPENYTTLNDLGTVYLFIVKNPDSAIYFLQQAIHLDSTLQPAWVNLGMAYRQQKEYPRALACYEKILKINPHQVKALFAMANVYNDMGDFDRAVKMNEDIMKSYPNSEMPYVNIGNYYMSRRDTFMAVQYWEKANGINPTYELCVQLNGLYNLRKDRAKAAYYYNLGEEVRKKNR